ncbi:unnamed protein product [Blepharisma stoltei]|uniref:carbonic anhydrase n=1 Tax=Blepharisma stoltei TaxID=1481888 RepID=A0AAU9JJ89_9CILI|nr:unnamed protein product [Blepharisma stoltei]
MSWIRNCCHWLFGSDHKKKQLDSIVLPEASSENMDQDAPEKLLKGLDSHKTQKGDFPEEDEWNYGIKDEESEWKELFHPGKHQSPINIDSGSIINASNILKENFYPLEFHYSPHIKKGKFNSKTLHIKGDFGGLSLKSPNNKEPRKFNVAQFHFHSPAEHLINGNRHDLELHIVHKEKEHSNLLVIGILFKNDGKRNAFIDTVMESTEHKTEIDLYQIIEKDMGLYYYEGSLTTPPLFETVLWFVSSRVNSLSADQLDFFARRWLKNPEFVGGKGNYREAQPLNDRSIVYFN